MKHYGPMPEKGQHYIRRPGAYALVLRGQTALLTAENSPVAGLEIQLPGGGIDPGETPVRALHREIMEETGWRISIVKRLGTYHRHTFMPDYGIWAQKVCHIFLARPTLRIGDPLEDHHTVVWAHRDDVVDLITQAPDAAFMADHMHRVP